MSRNLHLYGPIKDGYLTPTQASSAGTLLRILHVFTHLIITMTSLDKHFYFSILKVEIMNIERLGNFAQGPITSETKLGLASEPVKLNSMHPAPRDPQLIFRVTWKVHVLIQGDVHLLKVLLTITNLSSKHPYE